MKVTFIITLCLVSGLVGSIHVTGHSGGSVLVFINNMPNYMCQVNKFSEFDKCGNKTIFGSPNDPVYGRKFSLYESGQKEFAVLIRDLKPLDSGKYQLGFQNRNTYVDLKVHTDAIYVKSCTVTGFLEQSVSFQCGYPEAYKRKNKYLYKLNATSADEVIYVTHGKTFRKSEFFISDDAYSHLNVSIHSLSELHGGVYLCGVYNKTRSYISIFTTVQLHVTAKVGSVRVTGCPGGHAIIKYKVAPDKSQSKFICREFLGECTWKTYAKVPDEWHDIRGVSLYNDTSGATLIVFVRELLEETYRYGVDESQFSDKYTEVNMEVKEDLFCGKITSYVGYINKSVSFICEFPPAYRIRAKCICKEDENHNCGEIREDPAVGKHLFSNYSEAGIRVTIRNLSVSDAGVYWCGTGATEGDITYISLFSKVLINIRSSKIVSHEGDVAQVKCPYESKYRQNIKHFCKNNECILEQRKFHVETTRGWTRNPTKADRLSLDDDVTKTAFTVTISGVTAEDAGKYWCGVNTKGGVMYYLSTDLQIVTKKVLYVSGIETGNIVINCTNEIDRGEAAKHDGTFFCMGELSSCDEDGIQVSSEKTRNGRVSLADQAADGDSTVTISDLREEDSGMYWCGEKIFGSFIYTEVHLQVTKMSSYIIAVWVCLAVLLTGGLALALYKIRNNKKQDSSSSECRKRTNVDREMNHGTHHSASHNDVYMNASFPSSIPEKDKVQHQGPTYATVVFHKNPASPSNPRALSEEDSTTEYATVKLCPQL